MVTLRDHVWVIANDTYETTRLQEEVPSTSHLYSFLSHEDLLFPLPKIPEVCLIRTPINLFIPHSIIYLLNIIETLEGEECHVIPSSSGLKICDKMSFYFFWQRHLSNFISMPQTIVSSSLSQALHSMAADKDYVFKPIIGGMGVDVELTNLNETTRLEQLFSKYGIILLQEFIPNRDYDIRTLLIGSHPPIQYMRYSQTDFRHNIHQGGFGKTRDEIHGMDPEIDNYLRQSREIAQKIKDLTGLEMFGLDSMPSRDGTLHLLEINPFFGFKGAEETFKRLPVQVNVAKMIMDFLNSCFLMR